MYVLLFFWFSGTQNTPVNKATLWKCNNATYLYFLIIIRTAQMPISKHSISSKPAKTWQKIERSIFYIPLRIQNWRKTKKEKEAKAKNSLKNVTQNERKIRKNRVILFNYLSAIFDATAPMLISKHLISSKPVKRAFRIRFVGRAMATK